jgi:dihydroorotase
MAALGGQQGEEVLSVLAADDFHMHLRDGPVLPFTVACASRQFDRAIIMPNLNPPVTTVALALAYRERILAALPVGATFTPLMTLYLTDHTTPETIREAKASGAVFALKLYPAGATTNSASGVTDITKLDATLEAMQECGLPLLVHGEVVDPDIDIFDREAVFIERTFRPLVAKFPNLKFVMEHVTTAEGVAFVRDGPPNLAGTLTAHHLLYNRNALVSERDNDATDTHTTILHSLTPSLTRSPQRNNP